MVTLTVVSTFSGVGGIDLAFERAGCRTVLLCEIDKHARKVLAHRFPGVPIHPDITELTADDLHAAGARPESTVLVGGFPCQDLSVAGARRGLGHGTRSGLYWHLDRLMANFRPAWVVFENVPGLLSAGCPKPCPGGCVPTHGGAMGAVLGSLAERGYGFAYRVLDAQRFGVPQRRERVVIGDSGAAPAQVLLEPESGAGHPRPRFATWEGAAREAAKRAGGTVVSTLTAHHGRNDAASVAGGMFVPMTYQKVIRSGARADDGSLPAEVWETREVAATLSPFDLGSDSRATELVVSAQSLAMRGRDEGAAVELGTGISCGGRAPAVSFHLKQDPISGSQVPSLGATSGGAGVLTAETAVRRLTPLECERLQGHPDRWTAVDGMSDSQRYKQMGNGVAVPVFEWVARRLVKADAALREAVA